MSFSLFKRLQTLLGCSLAVATLLMSAPAFSASDTLRVATEGTYPPWSFKDSSGNLQGFDVDIANALCEQMKVKCQIIAQAWDGIIPGLQANRYDAIVASMSTTPARRKQVLFTNKYKETTSSFIVAKDSGITDVTPAGLKGKRIGVQRGSSQHQWLTANGYEKSSTLVLYDDTRQPELDLVAGRVDAIIGNKATAYSAFFKRAESKDFMFVGPELKGGVLGDGNAIAVRLDDTELCNRLNTALEVIIKNGTYDQIRKKYFPFPLM
ncbi:ABC transporter substrate-binding protein [Paraburkholderia ginsengiterrae]|uniref:ABC transporter substrate-binding protein n=1 Tax=Paraburkholderia ginsengiterrae TaxID=1462993 RepID=A0A1A9NAU8_9BURK|nr:transporter substrate-binding domain-containing protein [Paraburkholderia ginsengiterrae]OAJ59370.1 ABC transporter substrate-binding protein [Paraburkholderia ginsengiterrae]OAJ63283.1 ABC transporter substrate-binding protein [Paraburkholderia ginsengiterrae]